MDLNRYFVIVIAYISLYWVSLQIGKLVRKKRAIKSKPTKDYINKVINSINSMNGHQFEDFISFIYKELGYTVRQTPKTRDGGKDLVLRTKEGKVYVEIKRYSSKNLVSSPLLLKLIGSAVSDGVNNCIFLTTSGYTSDAKELAKNSKVKIKLIDINGVVDMVKKCNSNKVLSYLGY